MTARLRWTPALLAAAALSCAPAGPGAPTPARGDTTHLAMSYERPQYPSTYRRRANAPVFIRNVNVLSASGPELHGTNVLFADGKVVGIGNDVAAPAGADIVDGTGKWVTPGLIDAHSHLGVYAAPGT
ncbi:MAG TPA: hypothetical protein VG940_14030, partial [Gemmatimonadales bacterium]|nr:hypothetical protein [Gemmatimonadales bacterium]